jgi:hypothetical protein
MATGRKTVRDIVGSALVGAELLVRVNGVSA